MHKVLLVVRVHKTLRYNFYLLFFIFTLQHENKKRISFLPVAIDQHPKNVNFSINKKSLFVTLLFMVLHTTYYSYHIFYNSTISWISSSCTAWKRRNN